jgi:ATP-dependent protease ClpP protease subunit
MNQVIVTMAAPRRAVLEIYGDIGPASQGMIDVSSVSQKLPAAGSVDTIEVRVNSRGGSGYDGLAIANLLMDHPAKKVGVVHGIAASAATLPLMVCGTVRIPRSATFMVHLPRAVAAGTEDDMHKVAAQLRAVTNAAVALYRFKTGKTAAEIESLLAAETWYTGAEAVAARFADTVDTDSTAASMYSRESVDSFFRQGPWMTMQSLQAMATVDPVQAAVLQVRREAVAEFDRRATEPNERYRAEFRANPLLAAKMTVDEYIATRRIDDGLDTLMFAKPIDRRCNGPATHGVGSDEFMAKESPFVV